MARTEVVVTTLTDDLDGTDASQTLVFGWDGHVYEIDLNDDHAKELAETLDLYSKAAPRKIRMRLSVDARNVTASGKTPGGSRTPAQREESESIRAWANRNGYTVSQRGRIPAAVVADHQAHKGKDKTPGTATA
jgi:hypothetical protein